MEIVERECAGARELWQAWEAHEEREQGHVAKSDAVACRRQSFEHQRMAVERQRSAEVLFELGASVERDLDGGELPHAREKNFVVRAGIADEQRVAARIAKNGGGDADVDGFRLAARSGDFFGEVARAGTAMLRDGA